MLFYVPVEGVHKIGPLDIFFEAMSRFESRNDVFFDSSLGQDRTMWLNRGRLGFDYRTSEDTNIRVTYQYSNIQTKDKGTPPVAAAPAPQVGVFFFPTANYQARTRQDVPEAYLEHKSGDSTFRFGRQMVNRDWLVGSNNWGEVGRAWDGVSLKQGKWDMFAGRLDLDNPNIINNIGGAYLYFGGYDWGYGGKTSVYYKHDQFTGASEYTAGHTYHKMYGKAFVGVNGAFQWGRRFGVDHEAWAADGHVGFMFSDRLHGMVGYTVASGGSGSTDRNFDWLYPSDHGMLGDMDLVGLSNVSAMSAGLGFQVNDRIGVMYYNFKLFDKKSPWFSGTNNSMFFGGPIAGDGSGASGDNIGSEIDFNLHVMLPNNLRLTGGYSFFDPGSFVNNTMGGNSNQNWFYASLGWRY